MTAGEAQATALAPVAEVELDRMSTRAALAAALPHLPADGEDQRARVRLTFTSYRSAPHTQLLVSACDGYTGVVSRVLVDEVLRLPSLAVVDMPPTSVRDVLAVFKPPSSKDERAAWASGTFRLTVTDEDTTWQETGTLIEGRTLTVPRLAPLPESDTAYPDLPRYLADAITAPPAATEATYNPRYLARLTASAKAHSERLQLVAHENVLTTWTVGPHCAGIIGRFRIPDDEVLVGDRITADWRDDLLPLARIPGGLA